MKSIFSFIIPLGLIFSLFLATTVDAQVEENEWVKQAVSSFRQQDYTKARSLYLQAYNDLAAKNKYAEAVECGVQACALYYRDYGYTEAFNLCRQLDQFIAVGEQQQNRVMPELHFKVTLERIRMYLLLKNAEQAEGQLARLKDWVAQAGSAVLSEELLYTEADFFYTFGRTAEGDAAFQQLIAQYKETKQYEKINDCYRRLIQLASSTGNARLVESAYEKLILWNDSVRTLNAADAYSLLQKEYKVAQQAMAEKDSQLSGKQYVIVTLAIIAILLFAALVLGIFLGMRLIAGNKKLKGRLAEAKARMNEQARFVRNFSDQMRPTLDRLEAVPISLQSDIHALQRFVEHIEELASLEMQEGEVFERKPIQVATFCRHLVDRLQDDVKPGVELAVDAAPMEIQSSPEALERILLHLLKNAAHYTETGKIKLEFKKRAAHAGQFIVTDSGCGIPVEQQPLLFVPFSQVHDLSKGDGLGLPICALLAAHIGGTLTLDADYKRGCRFLLHLEV